ncbi:MAG: hypothetical protein DRJ64_03185 [Thermoprotei archaeon]|nr:MAG: hypothetical protein DRJ64_03185 [Thermoprotei archaeon]
MIEEIAASSILISLVLCGLYTFETRSEKRAIFAGSLTLSIFSFLYILTRNYIAAIIQFAYASSILAVLTFTSFELRKRTCDKKEYPIAASLTIVLLMLLFPPFIHIREIGKPLLEEWFSLIFFVVISVTFVAGLLVIYNILLRVKR